MNEIASIILAAGEGIRMKSALPKVLHKVSGKPMIEYVLDSVLATGSKNNYIIVGHRKEKVIRALKRSSYNNKITFVEQSPLLGSGHAVLQTKNILSDFSGDVVVTCGDIPLLTTMTLKRLIKFHADNGNSATILTAVVDSPFGYGRVIINKRGRVIKIVEEKDTTAQERTVNRINTGIYCFKARELFNALSKVKPGNKKNEYYLTDVIKIMSDARKKVEILEVDDKREAAGVNTIQQLAMAERSLKGMRGRGFTGGTDSPRRTG